MAGSWKIAPAMPLRAMPALVRIWIQLAGGRVMLAVGVTAIALFAGWRAGMLARLVSPSLLPAIVLVIMWLVGMRLLARGGMCRLSTNLRGKVAIVTGANTGIGKEAARALGAAGATVILACRDERRGKAAEASLRKAGGTFVFMQLDLSSFDSITAFAATFRKEYSQLDILLNSAGVMFAPLSYTKEGFELQFGVNHLGHALLTRHLLPLVEAAAGRIIFVSSMAHLMYTKVDYDVASKRDGFNTGTSYSISKLANVIYAKALQQQLREQGSAVTVVSLHPGVCNTELMRHMIAPLAFLGWLVGLLFMKTPREGAQTSIYCAMAPTLKPGAFYADCRAVSEAPWARDKAAIAAVWKEAQAMLDAGDAATWARQRRA